jgi:hypothetical protein
VVVVKKNLIGKNNQRTGVSTIANRYNPSHQPKFAIELPPLQPEKNCIKKISFPSKNFKNAYTQPNDRQNII